MTPMRFTRLSRLLPIIVSSLLAACTVARIEPPAPVPPPTQFREAASTSRSAPPPVDERWWQIFADRVLDGLQRRLAIDNENLKAAAARVAAAAAAVDAQRARVFPTLDLSASAGRSDNLSGASRAGASSSFGLVGTAAWEIDLWGRLSGATGVVRAGYVASAADAAALRLSAQATLTQTYLQLRAAERQQGLLQIGLGAYRRSLELTQARFEAGVVGRADVLQAQTQLANAQVQFAEQQTARGQLEHALAVLIGQPPSDLALAQTAQLPPTPSLPVLLPAELLARRPDIAAARERVIAAYAQIGLSESADLPSLNLSASAGYRSSALSRLLSAPNLVWSIGSSLATRLVDGGARQAASAQARANAEEALANYRQKVLSALAEVEDALIAERQLAEQEGLQTEALASAQATLGIVESQYQAGTVSYLNVIIAQNAALGAERSLADLQLRRLLAANALLRNIGGRWTPPL